MSAQKWCSWYDGAGVILFDSECRILLVFDTRAKMWSFPKGTAEEQDNHNPLETATRECQEEAGLVQEKDQILFSQKPLQFPQNRHYQIGLVEPASHDKTVPQAGEISEIRWVSQQELQAMDKVNSAVRHWRRQWSQSLKNPAALQLYQLVGLSTMSIQEAAVKV